MPQFKYKAVRDGKEYSGVEEASDKFALYKSFQTRGETIVSAKEIKKSSNFFHTFSISFGGIKTPDKIMFAKNLSAMLVAGLSLSRSLSVLSRQIKSKKFKEILDSLQEGLNRGQSFSQALKDFPQAFSTLFVSMVASGEESGNLSGALRIVGEQIEKTYLLQKKVKGAMMYPGIIFGVMIAIAVLMFVFVVPKLTETFSEFKVELPLSTRIVIGISETLQNNFIIVLIVGILAAVGIRYYMKSLQGKKLFHRLFLKIPIIGHIVQEVNSARLARTLSSLLTSGVDVVGALGITGEVVQNYHYQSMLKEVAEKVQKGQPLAPLFSEREDLYPVFVGEMIGVGEETGTLSKVLFDIAVYYENEVDQKTKDLSTVIEPFLMVFIGAGVGFFALAMISPIYSISNNI